MIEPGTQQCLNTSCMDCFQFISKEAEEDLQKGFLPGNTQQSMQWAMKVSTDWKKAREFALEEACLEGLLKRVNPEDLVMWLCSWQKCKTVKGPLCANMSRCTVNITFNQASPSPPPLPAIMSEELDQILEGFPGL